MCSVCEGLRLLACLGLFWWVFKDEEVVFDALGESEGNEAMVLG